MKRPKENKDIIQKLFPSQYKGTYDEQSISFHTIVALLRKHVHDLYFDDGQNLTNGTGPKHQPYNIS